MATTITKAHLSRKEVRGLFNRLSKIEKQDGEEGFNAKELKAASRFLKARRIMFKQDSLSSDSLKRFLSGIEEICRRFPKVREKECKRRITVSAPEGCNSDPGFCLPETEPVLHDDGIYLPETKSIFNDDGIYLSKAKPVLPVTHFEFNCVVTKYSAMLSIGHDEDGILIKDYYFKKTVSEE